MSYCIFAFDWWREPLSRKNIFHRRRHIDLLFKANNYIVIASDSLNLEKLNSFHNSNYTKYINNIHFNFHWYCYINSFINFNENPIHKLLISGDLCDRYPQRKMFIKYFNKCKFIENYKRNIFGDGNNNNYNKKLNSYVACFSSSAYVKNLSNNKIENTKFLLLKTYEILATGSLLVMPLIEKKLLEEHGLFHYKNCYLIDFSKKEDIILNEIQQMLNDPNIHKIRKEGQNKAMKDFTSENFFNEIKHILLPDISED